MRLALCLLLPLTGLLAGCPKAPPELPDEPTFARVTDPDARRQLALGKPLAAADIYTNRASRSSDPEQQQDYLLTAAEILFDRALIEAGLVRLASVPQPTSTLPLQNRRDILEARGMLYERDARSALATLPLPETVQSPLQRARVFETRAQSYRLLQDPDNELIARIELESQLSDESVIARSHAQIWQLLSTQPLSMLRTMTTNVRGDVYQGWIELALANAESGMNPGERRDELEQWRGRFESHPANDAFVETLYATNGNFEGFTNEGKVIEQIAVLLPMTPRSTATVSAAIQDGIVAAYEAARDRQSVPILRFYDVGENPAYVRRALENAIADGADAIIGPLRKQAVAAVTTLRQVPVPVVTLNTVETLSGTGGSENVVQFGLAPEDEARAAASRAAALSLKNAIILQADDSRGDREAKAFQDAMYAYGGDVVHIEILPKDEYDYSEQIRQALEITRSDSRFRTLSSTIGEKLFFEPSIRDDIDLVFLAVTSEQARSVRPQLDFFHASAVPRFGTSRVASLEDDPKINKDLNTIYYTEAPWVIRPSLQNDPLRTEILNSFPNANGVYAKLYALGIDAFQVVNNLDALANGEVLEGYTGSLELTLQGRVQRHPDWAQYRRGKSVPVPRIEADPLEQIVSGRIN